MSIGGIGGIGGGTILSIRHGLVAAVGLLATASVAGLLTVTPPSSVGLVTKGAEAPGPDRGIEVLAAGSETALDPGSPSPGSVTSSVAPSAAPSATTATSSPSTPRAAAGPVRKEAAPTVTTAPPTTPGPTGPVAVDTGVWVSRGGGPLQRISSEPGWVPLAWSPDSRSVAIARRGEIVLVDPVTGSRRPALLEANMAVERVAWSPDGRSLAVLLAGLPGPSKLVTVDLATRRQEQHGQISGGTNIAFTPGGCLAFGGSLAMRTDIDNSGIVVGCPGQPLRLLEGPLGTALQAVFPGVGYVYTRYASDISLMDFEGRPLPGLAGTSLVSGGTANVGNQVVVDPAGGTIVWAGARGDGPVQLHSSRPGGTTTTLSTCSVSAPAVSSTGIVAYADTCATPGRWSLLRRSPVSAAPQVLATFPYYKATTPSISPDGRTLVFAVTSS